MSYAELAELVTFRPLDRPLTGGRSWRPSPFKAPWRSTVTLLSRELRMLRARNVVMLIDFREQDLRLDGMPRADRRAQSPGIVLSMHAAGVGHDLRYEVNTFDDWQDNVRAVALGLESLRAVDRYGITKSGEQYAGWKQLTAGSGPSPERGRALIQEHGGVAAALKATHPDHDGDEAAFRDVQAAREAGVS